MEDLYKIRGEQKISSTKWVESTQKHDGLKILMTKQVSLEVQIKGNPFVSVAPTTRYMKIIDKTENRLLMRITTKNKDIPYCDCFEVEEEYLVASAQSSINSCVLQVTMTVNFLSWTMMKSIISSSTLSESKNFWVYYKDHLR